MKSRLVASISPLISGECKSSICKTISPKTLFHCTAPTNRLPLQRFESLRRSVHGSSDEDDGFSELGLPVAKSTGRLLKLVTEKPDPFTKTDHARKATTSKTSADSSYRLKDIFVSLDNHSPPSRPKHEKHNDNSKEAFNCENSSSISIENVPSTVNLPQLIDAISIFGKISSASMRTPPNGLDCCDVKFQSVESSRRAVSVGGITVGNLHIPIRPLYAPETVTFRIKSISKKTTEPKIHSMCKSMGSLEGLARAGEDVVDAFFSLKNESDTHSILKRLNSTVFDGCQWSAQLLPRNSIPATIFEIEDRKQEFSDNLEELKRLIHMKRVYFEDLDYLHMEIMHLEDQPTATN